MPVEHQGGRRLSLNSILRNHKNAVDAEGKRFIRSANLLSARKTCTLTLDALKKKLGDAYEEGDEEKVIDFIASRETPDRAGDLVRQDGWQTNNFEENPVILLNHNYEGLSFGQAVDLRLEEDEGVKALVISVLFFTGDAESQAIFDRYKKGVMRAVSVGFLPKELEEIDQKTRDALGVTGNIFKINELLELSLVTVPMHQEAVARSANKGTKTMADTQPVKRAVGFFELEGGVSYRLRENEDFVPDSFMEMPWEGAPSEMIITLVVGELATSSEEPVQEGASDEEELRHLGDLSTIKSGDPLTKGEEEENEDEGESEERQLGDMVVHSLRFMEAEGWNPDLAGEWVQANAEAIEGIDAELEGESSEEEPQDDMEEDAKGLDLEKQVILAVSFEDDDREAAEARLEEFGLVPGDGDFLEDNDEADGAEKEADEEDEESESKEIDEEDEESEDKSEEEPSEEEEPEDKEASEEEEEEPEDKGAKPLTFIVREPEDIEEGSEEEVEHEGVTLLVGTRLGMSESPEEEAEQEGMSPLTQGITVNVNVDLGEVVAQFQKMYDAFTTLAKGFAEAVVGLQNKSVSGPTDGSPSAEPHVEDDLYGMLTDLRDATAPRETDGE